MLALHELQKLFVRGLYSEKNEILNYIKSSTNLSSQEHLEIYRNSIIGSFQKVLKEIFPVVYKLVGDDFFIAMINPYIQKTRSTSPDVGDYGKDFPEFIASFNPANGLPYLSDVAKLEWAWHRVFNTADNKSIDYQKLNDKLSTSPENIVFLLPHESSVLISNYPIHRIWAVNQDTYEGDQTIILQDEVKYYYLVWRNKLDRCIDELTIHEWQILTEMQNGLTIGEIADKLHDVDLVQILPKLANRGWLADFN